MGFFWEKGPLFVRQLLDFYEEPRPHFNTLSTVVRGLEEKVTCLTFLSAIPTSIMPWYQEMISSAER